MKNSKILLDDFIRQIKVSENADEINAMAFLVFEKVLGLSRTDLLMQKLIGINDSQLRILQNIVTRINASEPLQYILEEGYFFGRFFFVDPSVLIPRPETEELVQHILNRYSGKSSLRILDVGTGSGCIPITLELNLSSSKVFAIDVSESALKVARRNAHVLGSQVEFIHADILNNPIQLKSLDVIVSNPPYIVRAEKDAMSRNVVDYEPHLALFVDDRDPLIFYHAITTYAAKNLRTSGTLWFEINARFGSEVKSLMETEGFDNVEILPDTNGKARMVWGRWRG